MVMAGYMPLAFMAVLIFFFIFVVLLVLVADFLLLSALFPCLAMMGLIVAVRKGPLHDLPGRLGSDRGLLHHCESCCWVAAYEFDRCIRAPSRS